MVLPSCPPAGGGARATRPPAAWNATAAAMCAGSALPRTTPVALRSAGVGDQEWVLREANLQNIAISRSSVALSPSVKTVNMSMDPSPLSSPQLFEKDAAVLRHMAATFTTI